MQKIALVTGASAGFGRAIVKELVALNYRVIAVARRTERLHQLRQEVGAANCLPLTLDVSDATAVMQQIAALPKEWTPIDVLVNNAGLARGLTSADQAALADWQAMIATNVSGLVNVTHAVLPQMVAANRGLIINLGSTAGTYAYYGSNVYGATKAFVKQFSANLRADLVGSAIRVSNIEPGLCGGTEFSTVRFHGDTAKAKAVYADVEPLTPQDIAATVRWIVTSPAHMNVNRVELMPVAQAAAGLVVKRDVHPQK